MKRMNKDILGICKTRLTGTGIIKSGNSQIVYSGGQTLDYGVSFVLANKIYKKLKGCWAISDRVLLIKK